MHCNEFEKHTMVQIHLYSLPKLNSFLGYKVKKKDFSKFESWGFGLLLVSVNGKTNQTRKYTGFVANPETFALVQT